MSYVSRQLLGGNDSMRVLIGSLLSLASLAASAPSAAQQPAADIQVYQDAESGARVATSVQLASPEVIGARYGNSPRNEVIVWIEAHKLGAQPTVVVLTGERLQWRLPDEVAEKGEYGPWDPDYPAYIGWPFQEADLQYLGGEITCPSNSHWCPRIDRFKVVLPHDVVANLIAPKARKKIRVSITGSKITQWETAKAELVATLQALGSIEEFQ